MINIKMILFLSLIIFPLSLFAQIPPKWKNLFRDIVEINSSSQNLPGLHAMRERLIEEFKALGFENELMDAKEGRKVLVFKFPKSSSKVLLIGHIDTVFEEKSPFQKFSMDSKNFKGPGVNDMKGGIVLMLMALSELKDSSLLQSVVVALNDDEEIGSPYSAPVLKTIAQGIPYALIYEPTFASPEHVTTTHAGGTWLELKVVGRASHAGAAHQKGINACVELAHKITQISKLTQYEKKLTVNPGVIQGGTKPNVVCEEATVKIDVRDVDERDLKDVRKKIEAIAKKSTLFNPLLKQGTQSTVTELIFIPSLPARSTQALFKKGQSVAKRLGFTLKGEHMGGASDANQLAVTGIELLSGLGPWGIGAHSVDEVADVLSFEKRKDFSVGLLKKILSE